MLQGHWEISHRQNAGRYPTLACADRHAAEQLETYLWQEWV